MSFDGKANSDDVTITKPLDQARNGPQKRPLWWSRLKYKLKRVFTALRQKPARWVRTMGSWLRRGKPSAYAASAGVESPQAIPPSDATTVTRESNDFSPTAPLLKQQQQHGGSSDLTHANLQRASQLMEEPPNSILMYLKDQSALSGACSNPVDHRKPLEQQVKRLADLEGRPDSVLSFTEQFVNTARIICARERKFMEEQERNRQTPFWPSLF